MFSKFSKFSKSRKCRFCLNIGRDSLSYAKVRFSGDGWNLQSLGEVPWGDVDILANDPAKLKNLIQKVVKQQQISKEAVHITLHSSFCVTRIVTGGQQEVETQLADVLDYSQHYLQMGLGDKVIGTSLVDLDNKRKYGHVSIVKCGLIEPLESSMLQLELDVESIDNELTSVCRLVGLSGIDRESPMLLIWLGEGGAQIGISHQGRLQLNYHAGAARTAEETARTVGKHLKRLRRFCSRYRGANGSAGLNSVLVLANSEKSKQLCLELSDLGFERILTLDDLSQNQAMAVALNGQAIATPGMAGALGGAITLANQELIPSADVYQNFLKLRPKPWMRMFLRNYWASLAASLVLVGLLMSAWSYSSRLAALNQELTVLEASLNQERQQQTELAQARELFKQFAGLATQTVTLPLDELVVALANSLPPDTRIDRFGIDSNYKLKIQGTTIEGDRTYEILAKLRQLSFLTDVSLESINKASNSTATFFQVQCMLALDNPSQQNTEFAARGSTTGGMR